MALLDVFKKKPKKSLDAGLPPPPMPGAAQGEEMPALPPLPEKEHDIPPIKAAVPPPRPIEHKEVDFPTLPPLPDKAAPRHVEAVHEEPKIIMPQELPPHMEETPHMEHVAHEEMEEIEAPEPRYEEEHIDIAKPVFVNIADYQEIMNGIEKIRHTLADSEEIVSKLNDLKNAEDKVFEDWRTHVEDIERKLTYIDQVIFRGE